MTDSTTYAPGAKYAAALAKFQAECPPIEKNKVGKVEGVTKQGKQYSYEYRYADLAAINRVALPILGRNGLSWSCKPTVVIDENGRRFALVYKLRHESGEEDSGEWPLHEQQGPQGLASEISYARRYTFCSMTGIAAEDDDDGAGAEAAQQRPKAQQQAQRRQRSGQRQDGQQTDPDDPGPAGPSPDGPLAGHAGTVTEAQQKKLGVQFRELGFGGAGDRDQRLSVSSKIVGRQLASATELSKQEASRLIDTLEKCGGQRDRLMALLVDGDAPGGDSHE